MKNNEIKKLEIRESGIYVYFNGIKKPLFITNTMLLWFNKNSMSWGTVNTTNLKLSDKIFDYKEN